MPALVLTPQALELFDRRRIFHAPWRGRRWKVDERVSYPEAMTLEPYCHIFSGHSLPAAMGVFSYSHSPLFAHVSVGRYCSIASNVEWMGGRHPTDWASTSSAFYDDGALQGLSAYFRDRGLVASPHTFQANDGRVQIGNDVWIGQGAMIAPGVKVSDGAVIGARALVLEDVPPYAVVVGAPARVMRYRFPPELIERLLSSEWWRFAPDVLQKLPAQNPMAFLDALGAKLEVEPPRTIAPIPLTSDDLRPLDVAS